HWIGSKVLSWGDFLAGCVASAAANRGCVALDPLV
ncbi:unnamed protein product, partial [Prunus brigantina]